jgi:hypothetical protein
MTYVNFLFFFSSIECIKTNKYFSNQSILYSLSHFTDKMVHQCQNNSFLCIHIYICDRFFRPSIGDCRRIICKLSTYFLEYITTPKRSLRTKICCICVCVCYFFFFFSYCSFFSQSDRCFIKYKDKLHTSILLLINNNHHEILHLSNSLLILIC